MKNKQLISYEVTLSHDDEVEDLHASFITIACPGFSQIYEIVAQYLSDNKLKNGEILEVRRSGNIVMDFSD